MQCCLHAKINRLARELRENDHVIEVQNTLTFMKYKRTKLIQKVDVHLVKV